MRSRDPSERTPVDPATNGRGAVRGLSPTGRVAALGPTGEHWRCARAVSTWSSPGPLPSSACHLADRPVLPIAVLFPCCTAGRGDGSLAKCSPCWSAVRRLDRFGLPSGLRQVHRHDRHRRRGHYHAGPGRPPARDLPRARRSGPGGRPGRPDRLPDEVKPSRRGSALCASKVTRPEELPSAMVGAYAYGPVAVIEQFITGTEVTMTDRGSGPGGLAGGGDPTGVGGVRLHLALHRRRHQVLVPCGDRPPAVADACATLALDRARGARAA